MEGLQWHHTITFLSVCTHSLGVNNVYVNEVCHCLESLLKCPGWVSTLYQVYHILFRQDIQISSKCWAVKRTLLDPRDKNNCKNNNKWCHVQPINNVIIKWTTQLSQLLYEQMTYISEFGFLLNTIFWTEWQGAQGFWLTFQKLSSKLSHTDP